MRRRARDAAFKCIYEVFFNDKIQIDNFFEEFSEIPDTKELNDEDKQFVSDIMDNYTKHKDEIMNIIETKLIGYNKNRTYKIDLALIILALVEVNYLKTPCSIVISEVLDLAKIYSTEKSPSFIHGFLASVFKEQE